MINFFVNCFVCGTIILGANMEVKNINHYICNAKQAQVIIEGKYYQIKDMENLNNVLSQMLQESHQMPALGVSIHTETIMAINKGVWLRLQYNGTQQVDDMPFDELLIEVNSEFVGFNIIRGNRGIYDGRCYYIDLNNSTMKILNDYITLNVIS